MRHVALLPLVPVLLLLSACGGRRIADPGPERAAAFTVPTSTKVAGREIEAVEEGPWVVRRTARSREDGRPKTRGGLTGAAGGRERLRGGSDAGDALEEADYEAPAGMREPSDATPPPPPPPSGAPAPTSAPVPPTAPVPTTPAAPVPSPEMEPVADPAEPVIDADVEDVHEKLAEVRKGEARPLASPAKNAAAPKLKAGSTDDNVEFEPFLEFLGTWVDQVGVADRYQHLDVTDRRFLRVLDGRGHPVPGARVHLVDETADRIVWSGRTYGDGRVPFYPRIVEVDGEAPAGGWLVDVRHGDLGRLARWDGEGEEYVVHLDAAKPVEEPVKLDVCILLDTTGSMRDEMARIKATLVEISQRLHALETEFDLRLGAVLYRDLGDPYVTMTHPFTSDVQAFSEALQGLDANGGGDEPESLNQGMVEAIGTLDWRKGAAHIMFVIADAPPHMDYADDVPYGTSLLAALDQGIRIHSVAASGLNAFGTFVFRQIAQFGRGKFIFIEYGSTAKSAASHGVTGEVKSNNLDDILYEQITAELEGWGRPDPEPAGEHVLGD